MNSTSKKRASNLELLRIVSMILIVAQHYGEHALFSCHNFSGAYLLFGGGLGVNLFVLISGYFMVSSTITAKKLLRLWFHVASIYLVISGACWLLMDAVALPKWGAGAKICEFFPILTGKYWFVSIYALLMLLSPMLNGMIQHASKCQLAYCIISLFLFSCFANHLPLHSNLPGPLAHFIMLYMIAAYMRFHTHLCNRNAQTLHIATLVFISLIALFIALCGFLDTTRATKIIYLFVTDKGVVILLISLTMFAAFLNSKIMYNQFINKFAACTFGVYLIHEHILLKNMLWQTVSDLEIWLGQTPFAIRALVSVGSVYIICTLLTCFWKLTFEMMYRKYLEERFLCAVQKAVEHAKRYIIN